MNRLQETLNDQSGFAVTAELVAGPGFSTEAMFGFLRDFNDENRSDPLYQDFKVVGITMPQNPGGVANLDPSDVLAQLAQANLLNNIDFIPHLSCKDANADALLSSLIGYQQRGINSLLALTGDKPLTAKGVFQLDSVGLVQLVASLNRQAILKAQPGQWEKGCQFLIGAAVSPFKYTEPSLLQQYYKMEKKIIAGADFLITQVGWDWQKSLELMRYLKDNHLEIPVLGNVYLLSTTNPAPRLMHDGKLPGCYVSDELYAKLKSESCDQHIERAAQQVAMYKAIGAAGVDIGGVHDFATFRRILEQAAAIGADWETYKDNLYFPPAAKFYLYNGDGQPVALRQPSKTLRNRMFDFMHRVLLDPEHTGYHALAKTMSWAGAENNPEGWAARTFGSMERLVKHAVFQCEECGDCYLPENFGYCSIGGCKKGLANAPCGDATVDGMCGNDAETLCRGEQIYMAAAVKPEGRTALRTQIQKPRNPELAHTSSILNYLFARDHTMKNALISIGEAVHASIPKTGAVMKELIDLGAEAYTTDSGPLRYMRALIEDQAVEGADFIAINVDAFGEQDPQTAVDLMVQYVKLVRQWSRGVPACIDSSNDDVLRAGLKEWFNTDQTVAQPLVNSIKTYTADAMMPLKTEYDFAFIGLLMSEGVPQGPGGSHSVEELFGLAQEIFHKAVNQYGFKPQEIFLDSTVFPLAIDMPMQPDVPGYTYRAFETIKRIKSDPAMKDVHCSLGISNCCRDLPGRKIGICRAYVAKAMEAGLDAGIVNVNHHYGSKPVDPGLMEMVEAFAAMDGSSDKTNRAITLIGQFCSDNRK
ncbi:methylenetetrahydrofolate reductase C-terminal domain-containing protein [Planctomycetota bacterium]